MTIRSSAVLVVFMAPLLMGESNGVVEGVVVSSVTRRGVGGVAVTLTGSSGVPGAKTVTLRATTDAAGAFRLSGVEHGEYTASYEKSGFFLERSNSAADRAFRIDAVNNHVRLETALVPWARLTGRVVDDEGRPAPGIGVQIVPFWRGHGSRTATNTHGEFVFDDLAPGRYRLLANPAAGRTITVEGQRMTLPPTYFPGFSDRSLGEPIQVRAGAELSGYEIRLRAVPAYRVQGVVLDDLGRAAVGAVVRLSALDPWLGPGIEAQTVSRSDGVFEFPAVRPGDRRFAAEMKREGTILKGFAAVVVSARDVENMEIRLSPPFTVEGVVEREEQRDSDGNRKVTSVYLAPEGGPDEQGTGAFHEQDGKIHIPNVTPGRYRIEPTGSTPGYYLEAVWLGEREVTAQAVDLLPGSPPIRVIYRPKAGRVRGTVDGGAGATVVVVPKNEAFVSSQFIRLARCETGGRFYVDSIRPGEYNAFAFDRVDFHALEDRPFVRGLAALGSTVRVESGEEATVNDLRVVSWPE